MPTTTVLEILAVDDPGGLYRQYDNESAPQPCHLSLDIRDGQMSCGYSASTGNSVPMDVYHNLVLEAEIPCLTADAANQLMNEVADLARTVLAGAGVEWDGNNHVGRLSDSADEAWDEIVEACKAKAENYTAGDLVVGYTAGEWFVEEELPEMGITAETSDEFLAQAADAQVRDAQTGGAGDFGWVVLDEQDVLEYLTDYRDRLREDVREQLCDVRDQIESATARRNRLVRQIRAWEAAEDTYRALGGMAGVSHTEIGRIVAVED